MNRKNVGQDLLSERFIMFLSHNKPALALVLAIMMIVTLTAATFSAEGKNYCHDPEA